MSKLLFVCGRRDGQIQGVREHFEYLSQRITPDNITPAPPRLIFDNRSLTGIVNPVDSILVNGGSVCLGMMFGETHDWWQPGAELPDGSYAILRVDANTVELVSDILASRTIWYVKKDDIFAASSSQRALVSILRSYIPNEEVYPWMLSAGTLGPGLSWDKRFHCVPGDSRLVLNRNTWEMKLIQRPVVFSASDISEMEHESRLRCAIEETVSRLNINTKKWILPLSGGYDSREILLMLKDRPGLKAITWGRKAALTDKKSDAVVARELAEHFHIPHEYFETDLSNETIQSILERFLVAGEGRKDNISGYMDGFSIWKRLYESGIHGVLRGDEAFGFRIATTDADVRRIMSLTLLSDHANLVKHGVAARYEQILPDYLNRTNEETLMAWGDRIFQTYFVPVVLAALNDLKSPYVEIINLLLSRAIINQVRHQPDNLRTGKKLFKKIVCAQTPDIAFAERSAIEAPENILKSARVNEHILEVLHAHHDKRVIPKELFDYITAKREQSKHKLSKLASNAIGMKRVAKRILPDGAIKSIGPFIRSFRRSPASVDIDVDILALRAYILCKMDHILCEDASAMNRI